ncbi:MAG: glycoside hydrolase family 2 [Planctomycetota bacterium]|nr:glycoside hydrolase family 2 [Planctomycetota bacterium]
MQRLTLNGTWQLAFGPQRDDGPRAPEELTRQGWPAIPANVPGNVELDLLAAGKIQEPSRGNHIYELRPYEMYEWWYSRTFAGPQVSRGQRVELVFEGLDCFGTVWLNGKLLGRTENMFIAQRFDVTELVRADGSNELTVRIGSAVLEGRRHQPGPGEHAAGTNFESLNVRKAPHMYGWDIMPRLVSAGLWREVRLEVLEPTRWRAVYWATVATDAARRTARALADWDFVTSRGELDGLRVRLTLQRGGGVVHRSEHTALGTHGRAWLDLAGVELWWPRGYGEAVLYDATAELVDGAGQVLATDVSRLGLRTIELRRTDVTTAEEPGEFVFVVNGEKVFIKGTNWVPLDALHSRDRQHLQAACEMLADLHCNMVRCWGGNVYEDHEFFDFCDAHGILAWQDFALACALYPQTDDFAAKMRAEAEAVVTKLRNHPSLALWSGNNEIDECYAWAGLGVDPNTDRLSRQVLPDVLRRLDPVRPYLPSSPYRSPELVRRGNRSELEPEQHLWGPRDDFKGPFYTGSLAHFVSEIGYHGCPDRRSLEAFLDPNYLWPWQNNDQWLTHAVRPHPLETSYDYRIALMAKQIAVLFDRAPDTLDDYILASQISQAEALKFFIERWRAGKWRRTGMLWWNLRDGWPIISDAIVDYYNRPKLAYAYVKRLQTDVCAICGEPQDGRHPLVVVNDTRRPAAGEFVARDADTGAVRFEGGFEIGSNGKATLGSVAQAARPAMWLLEWKVGGTVHRNHYLAGPRPFSLPQYKGWLEKLGLPSSWGST